MKVGVLTASVSPYGGGVPEVARALAVALHKPPECAVEVLGLDDGNPSDLERWKGVPVTVSAVRGPASFGYSPELNARLAASAPDLLHVHGLWMYPSVVAAHWSVRARAPYLVSPHGMLDSWALENGRLKKRAAHFLYEGQHLRRASCLHALCDAEADAFRKYGLSNPICVIPNGVEMPGARTAPAPMWRSGLPTDAKILLYLGRLHAKKGIAPLLKALDLVARESRSSAAWHLVVAGWDQLGHRAELESLAAAQGLRNVHFVGPQFQDDKHASFCAAHAFVLPSVSEGLPMTILEAWAHGLPVLMTDQCNLPEGFSAGAALRIEASPSGIAAGLRTLFEMDEARRLEIGERGRVLAERMYSWPAVAGQMRQVYHWLVEKGEAPDTVRFPGVAGAGPESARVTSFYRLAGAGPTRPQ